MFTFENKTVVVVGGTSGINLGIAQCFAKAGANVAVVSRSQDKVDAAVEGLKALGANAMGVSADVRNYEELVNAMDTFKDCFGEFDVLVSGAAGNFPARPWTCLPMLLLL